MRLVDPMVAATPVTLAGTLPTWTERAPDTSFDVNVDGRLRMPVVKVRRWEHVPEAFPTVTAAPSTRAKPATRRWRVRHQEDDLEEVVPLGAKT